MRECPALQPEPTHLEYRPDGGLLLVVLHLVVDGDGHVGPVLLDGVRLEPDRGLAHLRDGGHDHWAVLHSSVV